MFPRHVEGLNILIVTHHSNDHRAYNFIVSRHRVVATLQYKLENDPYYNNAHIDNNALASLKTFPIDVSSSLRYYNTIDLIAHLSPETPLDPTKYSSNPYPHHRSSFIPTIPNINKTIQEIRQYLHAYNHHSNTTIEWKPIGLSPIN